MDAPLPYGPLMTRLLRPVQRGFLILNGRFMAPALRLGLGRLIGNPFTGHILLLRTRGRKTGLLREAPLGYVLRDGAAWVVAGYGEPTPWYRNLVADPDVEVILPDRRFHGRAEPVTDDAEWLVAYRALLGSFGVIGRGVVGDVSKLGDAELLARHRALPVIRIRPTDGTVLEPGPFDPGGLGWLWANLAALAAAAVVWRTLSGRRRRSATPRR